MPIDRKRFTRALDVIRHRGPDGAGEWFSPDQQIALGHVRLAVVDPAGSPQPITNENGSVVAVVNGEFYGYRAIRDSLKRRGHVFKTDGDNEIIVHLYEEHGVKCFEHLRGEFALVLWDQVSRTLLAARDRFGVKPLCYHHDGQALRIASEAKALFRLGVVPAWDEASLWQVAGMQYTLPEATLFRGVHQVAPGGFIIARSDDTKPRRNVYWRMNYPRLGDHPREFGSTPNDTCEELLRDSVRERLVADVPVCFHLSGGLDSSSVVALAQAELGRPVDCFSVGFDVAPFDERTLAQETANVLGARFHLVDLSQGTLLDHLRDAVYFSEGLAINLHLPAKYLLAREMKRAGFSVVLSGEGSDELFAGYEHLRQDYLEFTNASAAAQAALLARNEVTSGVHLPRGETLSLSRVQDRVGFVPTFLRAKASLGFRIHNVLRPEFRESFRDIDPFTRFLDECVDDQEWEGRHPVHQAAQLWMRSALGTYILHTLGDGTEMAHAVEGRVPFLDHHLFDYAKMLRVDQLTDGVTGKMILRDSMRNHLPDSIRLREKMPFTAPPVHLGHSGATTEFLHDWLASSAMQAQPVFDPLLLTKSLVATGQSLPEICACEPVLMLALTVAMMQDAFRL